MAERERERERERAKLEAEDCIHTYQHNIINRIIATDQVSSFGRTQTSSPKQSSHAGSAYYFFASWN